MDLTQDSIHNVECVEIQRSEEMSVEVASDGDVTGITVDSVQFDDPNRVSFGTSSSVDLRAEYESAMCQITDADGHLLLHCQEW